MTTPRRQPDMDTYTVRLPRWLHRPRDPNPLRPATDRFNRLALVLAVAVALLAAPLALGVGAAVYESHRQMYAEQAQTRRAITATVTEDTAKPDLRKSTVRVGVHWYWAGMEHTGTIRVPPAVKPGDSVEIWVDDDGSLVAPPKSETIALLDALVVGTATWLVGAAVAAAVLVWVRAFQEKLRDAAWQRGIDRLMGAD